jgi:AraC family transcriptional regulator
MITVRIEDKPEFRAIGKKIWISGQDNEAFGKFWSESHENGYIDMLCAYRNNVPGAVTGSISFGISCVENDPANRAFYFYIATEKAPENAAPGAEALEEYAVPACKWAVFANRGELPMSLIDAEMYAFMQWLPSSGYAHAPAPELEVYPAGDGSAVEFWLPVVEAGVSAKN